MFISDEYRDMIGHYLHYGQTIDRIKDNTVIIVVASYP